MQNVAISCCCFSVTLCRQRRRNEHRIITHAYTAIVDLLRYRDTSSNVLQFSTFQRPLIKYLYKPFKSFHPSSNKKAIIKGDFMRYVRNSSSFNSFYETREKFWKRLPVRGYPFRFLLPLFREIRYSDRKKWFTRSLIIGQAWVGLLSLRLPSTVVTHVLRMLLVLSYQN